MAKATKTAVKKAAPKKTVSAKSPVKKAAPKKAPKKKEPTMKYSDKSAGQPELVPVFETMKKLLKPYVKAPIKLLGDEPGQYTLISHKTIEVAGKTRDNVWFAAAIVQKGYVGFYFTPSYAEPATKALLTPDLAKCLKGKSCFHLKKMDATLEAQIKQALKLGYEYYKAKGWV